MAKQTFTTGQVLTAAQMTSLQQTAMLGGAASAKTASYTLVAADAGTAISMSNASATTITVNTGLFAAGDTVQITNLGAGVCTITAGTATVNTSASLALAQYESGTLDFTSASAAIFIKGAGAAAGASALTLINTTTLSGSTTNVDSVFTSTYDNYLIQLSIDDCGQLGALTMQFRAGGSATTTGYYYSVRETNFDGSANAIGNGKNVSNARIGTTGLDQPSPATFHIFNPNRALRTTFQGLSQLTDTGASGGQMFMGGFVLGTTQFDGFAITSSASQTGKVRIYGYSN